MNEKTKVIVTNKDGVIWCQIFGQNDQLLSSFTSLHITQALEKAKRYCEENNIRW